VSAVRFQNLLCGETWTIDAYCQTS
jgi:hypothetical protein